ncbi:potassium channel family protein [Phytohalomonas tamaricis]|uniref:potassium channel family protein n=1 Tax=Phytohalomonas tamaricis TaxID=2081032 RepID=UPI000D0ACC69|nr:potassium channel family protein [Phytohalomonas tamaricis]
MSGQPLLGIIGVVIITLANYDAVRTTLSASNAGPITKQLGRMVWALLLGIHRLRSNHNMLKIAGPGITLLLLLCWIAMEWLGWFLLFCSASDAVVNSTTSVSATLVERAYFVGYTITTLGYGDFAPGAALWQLLAIVAAINGFFVLTLSVTYILSVVSAASETRQMAQAINAMGETPYRIIEVNADGGSFESLAQQMQSLNLTLLGLAQKHLAYPLLHYYHSAEEDSVLPLALAKLDQALTIALFACPNMPSTSRTQLQVSQKTLTKFQDTLKNAFVYPSPQAPEIPDLEHYKQLPFCHESPTAIASYLQSLDRQRLLKAYVEKDGWEWSCLWSHDKKNN